MDEGLDERPQLRVLDHGEDVKVYDIPDKLRHTNRDFIERVCQVASAVSLSNCVSSSKPRVCPGVIVIGTHKDKLGNEAETKAKLKAINVDLMKLCENYGNVLIPKPGSLDEVVFAMTEDENERQVYTKEIQLAMLLLVHVFLLGNSVNTPEDMENVDDLPLSGTCNSISFKINISIIIIILT